jgi:replicative DNA helicase Mcm
VKEALLLQLVGGVRKVRSDKVVSRGDTHILLVGDPGSGKSAMLKRISVIAPKGRYVSGRGISGAGLTAAVVKDEFLKGWSLEAGALVLASNGICCIDEMDKMISEDRAAMHEALEQQTVSISKANIQATLISRTTVLAAANPKFGRFDPFGIIAEQINMPPTLINRFDLIFPIKDLPDEARDEKMASHILKLHQDPDFYEPEISTEFLRKYIAYAKQKVVPTITNNALQEIKEFYLKMRTSGSEEGGIKAIPISARQLEALVRLTEATARLRLSDKATESDAKRAIGLIEYCLMEVGLDKETGKIDIDRIATGISASQRSHIIVIKDIITDLENKVGKAIPIDDVIAEAKSKGVDEGKVEEVLEKLKRVGEIFEPRRGFLSKI